MSINTTDPIADMLTRIRNAISASHSEISLPHSRIKESVANLLKEAGFIDGLAVSQDRVGKILTIKINNQSTNPKITEIVRLSKPGRRLFVGAREIPVVKRGRGMVILSTPQGLMSGDQARRNRVGGELICKVY
jgi:small subunit ribosomal protein S8